MRGAGHRIAGDDRQSIGWGVGTVKIWFNDAGRVVVENDEEQVAMPNDIALYLMRLGADVTAAKGEGSDDDLLAALKAEAER